jgi:YbbR domain-containing protein
MIRFLRNLFFQDFWLKLFSFALAVLTWFTVYFASQRESASPLPLVPMEQFTFANLPVMVISSASDVRSVRVNPKEVEVTVQGEKQIIQKLKSNDIRVFVDLSDIGAAHDLRKRIDVSTPAGVAHVRVQPEEVQVIYPPKS